MKNSPQVPSATINWLHKQLYQNAANHNFSYMFYITVIDVLSVVTYVYHNVYFSWSCLFRDYLRTLAPEVGISGMDK